jgi:ABC-type proline/glycine betaine transport system permease subunit
MFRRLLVEHWQTTLTLVSFAIFGAVFLAVLIRTWRASREEITRVANLPLEDNYE